MMLVIRISGQVDLNRDIEEALHRLRIRKKYSAVLIKPTPENLSLLQKLRNNVAFGTIDKETLEELIKKRAVPLDKKTKINAKAIVDGLDKKSLAELGVKPFFRLHPPRKGIESKKHFGVGKGVLGDNREKINDLVRRML
ncbi:50S ribosomal protein L30 [Candidatus Pacearchaeota archaeon]|nr:50S ribosomal protein L30 [Candidatus Pacearchaeota archaeon]